LILVKADHLSGLCSHYHQFRESFQISSVYTVRCVPVAVALT